MQEMEERIEDYFEQKLSDTEKAKFEADLKSDPELADAVAFYLVTKKTLGQQRREKMLAERHAEWKTLPRPHNKFVSLRTWYAVAAAIAAIAFGLMWYVMMPVKQDLQQLAAGYATENFATLNVQMGETEDSVQLAISRYNGGQFAASIKICEDILKRDPQNTEAKKVAGIASFKLLDYDKAINYFHLLGEQKNLYANPGKFYEAITLLQRGDPTDKETAEQLLKEVINEDLEGKEEAVKWMK